MNQKVHSVLNGTNKNYIFPFLWLHGESEEVLREYMRVIQDSSIGAVCGVTPAYFLNTREKWL